MRMRLGCVRSRGRYRARKEERKDTDGAVTLKGAFYKNFFSISLTWRKVGSDASDVVGKTQREKGPSFPAPGVTAENSGGRGKRETQQEMRHEGRTWSRA